MKKLFILLSVLFVFIFAKAQESEIPGTLDPSFGDEGVVITKISTTTGFFKDECSSLIEQPDGKIIALGWAYPGRPISLIRYNPDGTLDETFGTGGKITHAPTNYTAHYTRGGAILNDGKIVLGGHIFSSNTNASMLARLNSDGTLDNTFGNNGFVLEEFGVNSCTIEKFQMQSDGKYLLAGYSDDKPYLVRFNQDGSLDNAFGENGHVQITIPDSPLGGSIYELLACDNGDILFAGVYSVTENPYNWLVGRLKNDGSLDNTFGVNGILKLPNLGENGPGPELARALGVTKDNKIIVAGELWVANVPLEYNIIVLRLNSDGSIDNTFGENGETVFQFKEGSISQSVSDLVIGGDETIYISGNTLDVASSVFDLALAALTPEGQLDENFGKSGITNIDLNGYDDESKAMIMQKDGKLLVGSNYSKDDGYVAVLRFFGGVPVQEVEMIEQKKIKIYPNPVKNILKLQIEGLYKTELYDINGRLVKENVNEQNIDVSNINSGVYMLKIIQNGKTSIIKKIIKM